MRLEFQKKIASSQFTLPLVCILAGIIWLLLPPAHSLSFEGEHYGLWTQIPGYITNGSMATYAGMGLAALGVYLIAELTNTFVLLRISSRMLSSVLALLLGTILCLHTINPGLIVMVLSILSFFGLFFTYQQQIPTVTFLSYLAISIASLVFPKLLFIVPIYWLAQIYLRSLSIRCWIASILGVLSVYWIFFGISMCTEGGLELFLTTCLSIVDLDMPDYSSLPLSHILIYSYLMVFFLVGTVNCYMNSFLDKTRTRIIYKSIIMHGFVIAIAIAAQPHFFHVLLPLLMVDSAMVGGHYIALTYNRFSHLYCIVMLLLLGGLTIFQILG